MRKLLLLMVLYSSLLSAQSTPIFIPKTGGVSVTLGKPSATPAAKLERDPITGIPLTRTLFLNVTNFITRGRELASQGNVKESLPFFMRAVQIQPSSVEAHYYAAMAHIHLGNYFAAEVFYDRINELTKMWVKVSKSFDQYAKMSARAVKAREQLGAKLRQKSAEQNYDDDMNALSAWLCRVELCENITISKTVATGNGHTSK